MNRACLGLLFAGFAAAAQPATGVDEPPRRGTWVETSLGVFTAMGGRPTFSSPQPYLGLTVGRDLGEKAAVFASLALSAASASCYQLNSSGDGCLGADSFGALFAEGGASYGFPMAVRTLLSLKMVGGFTDFSPAPVQTSGAVRNNAPGFHLGLGGSIEYATHLDHFAVGIDALYRYTFARYGLTIPSLAVMPRIRYVF